MPSRCANSIFCKHDPACEDESCEGRPAPGPCSACSRIGTCIAPQACHRPEASPPPRRRKTFLPTFELRGPYRPKRLPRRGWPIYRITGALLLMALLLSALFPHFHR